MALTLNNQCRLICHSNKETKLNQTVAQVEYIHIVHKHTTCISIIHVLSSTASQGHNNKDACKKTSLKICTSHFIARDWKGCSRFACERELEIEYNCNILTPNLWPSSCVFLVLLMLNRRSRGHSAGWWLSLRHLISIFSGPQLIRAQRPLQPDVAFLTTSRQ